MINREEIDGPKFNENAWEEQYGKVDYHILRQECVNCGLDLAHGDRILFVATDKGKVRWWHQTNGYTSCL